MAIEIVDLPIQDGGLPLKNAGLPQRIDRFPIKDCSFPVRKLLVEQEGFGIASYLRRPRLLW